MTTDWVADQAARIGDEIKRLRGKRSGQWLSDRTEACGYRVARTTISELENHKRKYVTTAELVVMARALDAAPIALLYPPPYAGEIEVLPGVQTSTWGAVEWFSGDGDRAGFADDSEAYDRNLEPLRVAARLAELERRIGQANALMRQTDDGASRQRIFFELGDLMDQHNDLMARTGAKPIYVEGGD